jgi:hypothetical protein
MANIMSTIICWWSAFVASLDTHSGSLIALFTFVLAVATIYLWRETRNASKIALEHARALTLSERAYVKISHTSPNLIREDCKFTAIFDIKNYGRTPATVTDVVYNHLVLMKNESLPLTPKYDRSGTDVVRAFLVTGEEFSSGYPLSVSQEEFIAIESKAKNLFIYGYVDYIDQFGNHYRAGFARQYDPTPIKIINAGVVQGYSNLFFVNQPGYNDDRIRKHGEGNDWDEPKQEETP